jgi:hypothetical protein
MRLSYCYPTPAQIHEGVRRLAAVINDDLDLRHTFGATHPAVQRGYEGPNTDLT